MSIRVIEAGGAPLARIVRGSGPVLALALHAGHAIRPGLEQWIALSDAQRMREEDPFTADMAPEGLTSIQVLRSRFEVDLNRPRYRAVYQGPRDAWGLQVYRGELPDEEDRISRGVYDSFYAAAFEVLSRVRREHGRFVVLDLHSYNHRRAGANEPPAEQAENPDVNLGTRRMVRDRWAPVVDGFIDTMRQQGFDCRENVKFGGGHFAHWVRDTFGDEGTVLAVEFKKVYVDEWTGAVDSRELGRVRRALEQAVPVVSRLLEAIR